MSDLSDCKFTYGGKNYFFMVSFLNDHNTKSDTRVILSNSNIIYFDYTNTINQLVLTGSIDYVDELGQIDQFIHKKFAVLRVTFACLGNENSGSVSLEKIDQTNSLSHDFLLNNVEILERSEGKIVYRFSIISINLLNCLTHINLTNYGKAPEDIIKLLQDSFQQCELKPGETFSETFSKVKLNYITGTNDNLFSVCNYLLNKEFYYNTKDQSVKALMYNENKNVYEVFDFAKAKYNTGSYIVPISFFNSNTEKMASEVNINLVTVTKFTKQKNIISSFKHNIYDYDYNTNIITKNEVSPYEILNYYNNTSVEKSLPKYTNFKTTLLHTQDHTYWNNSISIYDDIINDLLYDNALVVTVDGDLLRKPCGFVSIQSDRNMELMNGKTKKEIDEIKNRYKALEGSWIILKVRHVISEGKYLQNLVLNRNFLNK